MTEYDNTDNGAAFPLREGQRFILTGKLNNAGEERPHALMKDVDRDGKDIIVVYKRVGVMYKNDTTDNEKMPDYSGPIDNGRRISGWKRNKEGMNYMSLKVRDKMEQREQPEPQRPSVDMDDSIPF